MQVKDFLLRYNQGRTKLGLAPVVRQTIFNLIQAYNDDAAAGVPHKQRRGIRATDVRNPNAKHARWIIDNKYAEEFFAN